MASTVFAMPLSFSPAASWPVQGRPEVQDGGGDARSDGLIRARGVRVVNDRGETAGDVSNPPTLRGLTMPRPLRNARSSTADRPPTRLSRTAAPPLFVITDTTSLLGVTNRRESEKRTRSCG